MNLRELTENIAAAIGRGQNPRRVILSRQDHAEIIRELMGYRLKQPDPRDPFRARRWKFMDVELVPEDQAEIRHKNKKA